MNRKNHEHQRLYARRSAELNGNLPGRIMNPSNQQDLVAKSLDVSKNGFSLLVDQPYAKGTQLWLILEDRYIKLEVVYSKAYTKYGELYQIGLARIGSSDDLEKIFLSYGCFKRSTA